MEKIKAGLKRKFAFQNIKFSILVQKVISFHLREIRNSARKKLAKNNGAFRRLSVEMVK